MLSYPTRPGQMCRCDECNAPDCSEKGCTNAATRRDGLCNECRSAKTAESAADEAEFAEDLRGDDAMERDRDDRDGPNVGGCEAFDLANDR